MGRGRLITVALLCAVAVVGIPFPVGAGTVPPTVRRDVTLEAGSFHISAAQGASLERRMTSLPINPNLVAVSFRAPGADHELLESVIIELRAQGKHGWSEWQRLILEPDEAPDGAEGAGASDRVFSSPLWVGTARAAEVRLVAPPGSMVAEDLRLHLINTLGDAKDSNPVEKVVGMMSKWLRGSSANAMTTQPTIISRAGWGADESLRECCLKYADAVHLSFIHHTAGTNSYAASESAAIVRSIYAYHVKNRGWSDIGYNFLVDRYGQIFEGRYGGITRPVIGAHTKGFNTGSTGISLMGTFSTASPTGSMLASLKNLLAWKLDVHHIPPIGTVKRISAGSDKWPAGAVVTFNRISGHRDGQLTSCPGTKAYGLLPSIRSDVSKIGLPKLYLPAASTSLLSPDDDGVDDKVTLTGSFTTTVSWTAVLRKADGSTVKSFAGVGTGLSVSWDGKDPDGTLMEGGPITWTIAGANLVGALVRPATGTFAVLSPTHVVGDWDGDGEETPGTLIGQKWSLHNDFDGTPDVVFSYGRSTDRPVAGDWDGDGKATPGIVRGDVWYLNNGTDPIHDVAFAYGAPTDFVLAGDWDGDGDDTPGVRRGNIWYLNDNFDASHDGASFGYGATTDSPVAGDWNDDGTDTVGVVRANVWYLNNNRDGVHDVTSFGFGNASDHFVVGDWNGSGVDVAGVFREPKWYLRDENTAGEAVIEFKDLT